MASYEQALEESIKYFNDDDMAADVFVSKYALTDGQGDVKELTPDDMHRRLAKDFARIEKKYINPLEEEEIYNMFKGFEHLIPQGSPMSAIGNDYQIQSVSNCFVLPPVLDSYGSILKTDEHLIQISKRRGGNGVDISNIRPRGILTNNASKTTDGIGVFMERYSNSIREVGQSGRRGALMITISVHHPEILTFIKIKKQKRKVTGANLSIRLSDEFMNAVKNDTEYQQKWPIDSNTPSILNTVKAKDIWNEIIDAAWDSAEPGLLFWDTATKNTPSDIYKDFGFKSVSTNPCIVGDTLIATADGRNAVSIRQLVEENKDIPVYSTNIVSGKVEIKMGRNPRKTGDKKEVWKLILDDNSYLIATPNHKVLLKDLQYKELKDLSPGDSIYPFYSFNSNGYRQISNVGEKMIGARRNRRQYRLVYEFNNIGNEINPKTHDIHHRDFNSYNDNIENLEMLTKEVHKEIHSKNMMGDKNPYFKMSDEWKEKFASHPGEKNARYCGYTNEQLIEEGKKLFDTHGKFTTDMWAEHAKINGFPQYLGNDFRFKTFSNFKNQVCNNHKVISCEFLGYEDVYNITVDDNNNYHIITSNEDENFVVSSGICIKNCGEIILSAYDSCRLLLVNLFSFVENPFTDKAKFNYKKFDEYVMKAQRLMDDLIDIELEQIDKILAKIKKDPEPDDIKRTERDLWIKIKESCVNGRRTGLGITALGDAIAGLNVIYGSDESIKITEKIYKHLAVNSHKSSVILAKERGAFPVFNYDLEKDHEYLNRIYKNFDEEYYKMYKKYGRRNIAITTTAPAGSTSMLTQTTSGIEPSFLLKYFRKRKINANDKQNGKPIKVDFVDASGDKWQEYEVYHHKFKMWMDITGKSKVEDSPYHKATSNDIDWLASVKIQAAAQKYVDHSISKTCNIPKTSTRELVSEIYMMAWETGCKGFTVYRDGCRDGVLTSEASSGNKEFNEHTAPKRPNALECDVHNATIKGESWTILIGKMHGRPYEIFGGLSKFVHIPKNNKDTFIVKRDKKVNGSSIYDLVYLGIDKEKPEEDQDGINVLEDIVDTFHNPTEGAFTRTLSLALRHGCPIQYVVEQLQKDDKDSDMYSFSRVIARVLKHYVKDGIKSSDCPSCKVSKMIYREGCVGCPNCGYSKC